MGLWGEGCETCPAVGPDPFFCGVWEKVGEEMSNPPNRGCDNQIPSRF